MTDHRTDFRLSRRHLLTGSAALGALTLTGLPAFAQAAPGGDLVFLID